MELSLGFSPCPNDTFIFDALVNKRIDTHGIDFRVEMADVEALNKMAMGGVLDITKLSYAAYGFVRNQYVLSNSGSALGAGCGPLLITLNKLSQNFENKNTIAIPGSFTTANFLCSFAFPDANNKQEMLFSEIEDAVLSGKVDVGVIIHENRFTYQQKGLHLVTDLGAFWEEKTGFPIPLGGIAIRRTLDKEVQQLVQHLIQESVIYAFKHPEASREFIRCHAQEMDEAVTNAHIQLYVNHYSQDLRKKGRAAICFLMEKMEALGWIEKCNENLFVE